MYHDEFAPRSVRNPADVGGAHSGRAIEVGGGVSAAAASAIVLPEMPILLSIGGLLPMVACGFGILMGRCREARAGLLKHVEAFRPGQLRPLVPSVGDRRMTALRGPRFALRRHQTVRSGFDRSRRLG